MRQPESGLVSARLEELGIELPLPWALPAGVVTSASFVRVHGNRLLVSGHVPLDGIGKICGPYGKVGAQVSVQDAVDAAGRCTLAMLSSIKLCVGSLDQIAHWLSVKGYVNHESSFNEFPRVMNGCSDLLISIFGQERGAHARLAVGVSGLPFDCPVEIEAELALV